MSSICDGRRGGLHREWLSFLAGIQGRALGLLPSIIIIFAAVPCARFPWLLSPILDSPSCSPFFLSERRFPTRALIELVALISPVAFAYKGGF